MNSKTLAKNIAEAALDRKAHDLVIMDLRKFSSFTEYFIVCSGTSDRQVRAIADSIDETMRKKKILPIGMEGYNAGRWILLDYGDVVAHVFYTEDREHYQLEKLWSDAPRIKS